MSYLDLLAFVIALVIGIVLTPVFIPILKKLKFGQEIRQEGPEAHLKKAGTPTMGGIVIVIAFIIGAVVFCGRSVYIFPVILFTFLFAVIGFLDDFLKIRKHESEGLKAWQKMGFQLIVMILLILYIVLLTPNGTSVVVPFYGLVDFKGWFIPLAVFAILGTVNGANFTDGLDGLASSVTIVIAAALTFSCAIILPQLAAPPLAMIGALSAFLIFNAHPAKIFMGDGGSLYLGFMLSTLSILGPIKSATIVAVIIPVLVLGLPIFDTAFAIFRRLVNKRPIMEADKGHLHHRLMSLGYEQRRATLMLYCVSGIMGVAAVTYSRGLWVETIGLFAISFLMIYIFLTDATSAVPKIKQQKTVYKKKAELVVEEYTQPEDDI